MTPALAAPSSPALPPPFPDARPYGDAEATALEPRGAEGPTEIKSGMPEAPVSGEKSEGVSAAAGRVPIAEEGAAARVSASGAPARDPADGPGGVLRPFPSALAKPTGSGEFSPAAKSSAPVSASSLTRNGSAGPVAASRSAASGGVGTSRGASAPASAANAVSLAGGPQAARAAFAADIKVLENIMSQAAAMGKALPREKPKSQDKARLPDQKNSGPGQPGASGARVWPVKGRITQEFGGTGFYLEPPARYQGKYYPHFHNGLDIAAPRGTPIRAFRDGIVATVGMARGYGQNVVLGHPGGMSSLYAHMETGGKGPPVRPGQAIRAGDVVGYVGMTGMTTGPHLHFVVRQGDWVNPRGVLPR